MTHLLLISIVSKSLSLSYIYIMYTFDVYIFCCFVKSSNESRININIWIFKHNISISSSSTNSNSSIKKTNNEWFIFLDGLLGCEERNRGGGRLYNSICVFILYLSQMCFQTKQVNKHSHTFLIDGFRIILKSETTFFFYFKHFFLFCATMWIFHERKEPIFVWINCECRRRKCCGFYDSFFYLFISHFCWWMEIFTWSTLDVDNLYRCNVYKDVFQQKWYWE